MSPLPSDGTPLTPGTDWPTRVDGDRPGIPTATSIDEPGNGAKRHMRGAPILVTRAALISIGCYVGAQVISQVTSLKIGVVLGRAVDMGTFIYPITFTLRDLVHKTAGRQAARTMILTSALVNAFLAAYLAWTVTIESDPDWGLGQAYADVLGPIWRIVVASLVAMVISELIDTEVYHWWVTKVTTRFQWLRVLVSNAVSVPVDNAIFVLGAFASLPLLRDGALDWGTVGDIFLVNLVLKGLVSVASLPLIYLVPDRGQQTERP